MGKAKRAKGGLGRTKRGRERWRGREGSYEGCHRGYSRLSRELPRVTTVQQQCNNSVTIV
jgi:hypothetical protein